MADFDIDSVTRMLGREPDQEINGLHYEAVDRAAHAALLSTEELDQLVASPQVREALAEWSTAVESRETANNRYLDVLGDTTDYEELDHRENMSSIAYDRVLIVSLEWMRWPLRSPAILRRVDVCEVSSPWVSRSSSRQTARSCAGCYISTTLWRSVRSRRRPACLMGRSRRSSCGPRVRST